MSRNEFIALPKLNESEPRIVGGTELDKNQYRHLWPYDRTLVKFSGGYINASHLNILPSLIVSQGPKLNTVNDFWSMCSENGVKDRSFLLERCWFSSVIKSKPSKDYCFSMQNEYKWKTAILLRFHSPSKSKSYHGK